MPIQTEYHVQKVKWHLTHDSTLSGLIETFGEPSRKYSFGGDTIGVHGQKITLSEGEELWVYNREGIPYWIFAVVTADDATISRHYVDRFW